MNVRLYISIYYILRNNVAVKHFKSINNVLGGREQSVETEMLGPLAVKSV